MQTLDLGNNEVVSRGIAQVGGEFVAMAYTQSKTFKTLAGAKKWLAAKGGAA